MDTIKTKLGNSIKVIESDGITFDLRQSPKLNANQSGYILVFARTKYELVDSGFVPSIDFGAKVNIKPAYYDSVQLAALNGLIYESGKLLEALKVFVENNQDDFFNKSIIILEEKNGFDIRCVHQDKG